jgi:hypothetical protein
MRFRAIDVFFDYIKSGIKESTAGERTNEKRVQGSGFRKERNRPISHG